MALPVYKDHLLSWQWHVLCSEASMYPSPRLFLLLHQVPFHLSVLSCAEEVQHGSQTFALSALATFLDRAIADGILDTATNKQSSLTASMQQQFEAAELLLNLPCLFMDTTDTLLAAEPDGDRGPYWDPLSKAKALLQVYHRLQHVWPSGVFTSDAAATAAAPAGELALAVLRYMPHAGRLQSDSNSQRPGGKEAAPPFWGVHALEKAIFVLHQISVTRFGGRIPSQGPARIPLSLTDIELMRSPSYLPGLGVLLCTMAYSLLIQHKGGLPGLVSNSSSASAAASSSTTNKQEQSSSTTQQQADSAQQDAPASNQGCAGKPLLLSATANAGLPCSILKAWERASRHSQLLPASQQLLFKLLDVEAWVVLWAASCRSETALGHNVSGPIAMLRSYLDFANSPAQQRLRSAEHEAQLQEQLACLALFGLYWDSYQPLTDSDVVDASEAAAAVGLQVLKPRLQQAAQHKSADPAAAQQQLGALLVVQEALVLLPHVLSRLVPKDQQGPSSSSSSHGGSQDLAAAPAGSSAHNGSNKNNTSSSSSTTTADTRLAGRRRAALEQLLGVLLGAAGGWLQPEVAAVTSQQQTSAQQQSAVVQGAAADESEVRAASAGTPTVAAEAKALWARHTESLAAQLEAFIRSSAAACPTGPLLLSRESVLCAVAGLCREYASGAAEGCLVAAAAAAGPGSAGDTKLVGLMCSLLKYHGRIGWQQYRSVQLEQQQQQGVISSPATDLLAVVAYAATAMLAALAAATSSKPTAAGGVQATKQLRRAKRVLPWLALFGRCCLQWSGQLQQLPASALSAQPPANHSCQLSVERELHVVPHDAEFCVLVEFQAGLRQWLSCGTLPRLVAAGYPITPVLRQLEAAATALSDVWTAQGPQSATGTDRMSLLVDAMESLGQGLCALPVTLLCNNPACVSVSGPSETAAVSGRNCMCGACRVAHYCCRDCQRQHWKEHKPACKALVAAKRPC